SLFRGTVPDSSVPFRSVLGVFSRRELLTFGQGGGGIDEVIERGGADGSDDVTDQKFIEIDLTVQLPPPVPSVTESFLQHPGSRQHFGQSRRRENLRPAGELELAVIAEPFDLPEG